MCGNQSCARTGKLRTHSRARHPPGNPLITFAMGITRRAFWLGNSMTYRPHSAAQKYGINVPHVLQIIAQANGDDHIFDWSVAGGSSICWHIHRFNLTRALAAANYDAIVMQSIHGPCDKVTCIWPCAQEIVEIARANGVPQVALRASWAKPRDGDLLAVVCAPSSKISSASLLTRMVSLCTPIGLAVGPCESA